MMQRHLLFDQECLKPYLISYKQLRAYADDLGCEKKNYDLELGVGIHHDR